MHFVEESNCVLMKCFTETCALYINMNGAWHLHYARCQARRGTDGTKREREDGRERERESTSNERSVTPLFSAYSKAAYYLILHTTARGGRTV